MFRVSDNVKKVESKNIDGLGWINGKVKNLKKQKNLKFHILVGIILNLIKLNL